MSGNVWAGERAISCEVMTLFDVPTMPLFSLVQLTSISGKTTCARAPVAALVSARTAPNNAVK